MGKELSLHASDLEQHTNEVSGLRKDIAELKKQLSDKSQEVLNNEHAINVLTSGNEHLGQENAVLEKKNLGLESEIAILKQRMVEMEALMDKLKSASAVAEKAKAKNDSDMKASQAQIDSLAARIQQLLEVISDREDALEAANRETKRSIDDSANKGREATMEIDTLKGELANCHSNCDLLADDLKVCKEKQYELEKELSKLRQELVTQKADNSKAINDADNCRKDAVLIKVKLSDAEKNL